MEISSYFPFPDISLISITFLYLNYIFDKLLCSQLLRKVLKVSLRNHIMVQTDMEELIDASQELSALKSKMSFSDGPFHFEKDECFYADSLSLSDSGSKDYYHINVIFCRSTCVG